MSERDQSGSRGRKTALFLLKLVVSCVFVSFVFTRIDLSGLKESLAEVRVLPCVFAFVVLVSGGFAGALSWYGVIRSGGMDVGYGRVAGVYWRGMFFNSFLPSNIGGDFFKGWMLVRQSGADLSYVVSSIIVDRIMNFSLLILTGLVSFALACGRRDMAAAALAVAVAVPAALAMTVRCWREKPGDGRLLRFSRSLFALFRSPARCIAVICAAAVSQGCKIGCHLFIIKALGLAIDPSAVWYVIPLFGLISAVPVSLGGLGVRESAAVGIAAPAGIVPEELVALSLASHLLFVAVNCLGVVPFLLCVPKGGGNARAL